TGEAAAGPRAPINVALVLDRSGSMQGGPLAAAKAAARRFAGFLAGGDRLSVVAFDDEVRTLFGPAPAGDPAAAEAIERVQAGGSTNLSGGWLKGLQHVQAGLVDGVNRVVLLTDGQANAGVTDVHQLVAMAQAGHGKRISTTCIGFGAHFNERLLEPMARQGGGNYWYVERDDQMAGIFEEEIEGLVALAAQNVELEVTLTHPRAAGVTFLQSLPVETTPQGTWRVVLGDLYATSPKALGLLFHVEEVRELGQVEVARVRIEADVVTAAGIEHRTIVMPVVANLDGADHPEPVVEQTFLRFEAARAREEAVRRADHGDFDGAAACLRTVAETIAAAPYEADASVAEEVADLRAQAERLEERRYSALDRKYDSARAMASREMKEAYLRKMSRRPRPGGRAE
ncbi:MAG TPA: VWA domain-containing protein, partial [Gemmatimonadales bacterium]|nr:VWA domain-containing protein [Gemmatimonadales bacterium]